MEKIKLAPNGQWSLNKFDDDYSHIHDMHTSIPTGKHTVEVHPHMDKLYNIKGHIQDSGKGKVKVSDLKRLGYNKKFIEQHVPKDANGWITEKHIDDHVAQLPKHKLDIHVAPYKMGSQQHRPGDQHVVSVHMHDDTANTLDDDHWNAHNLASMTQHKFDGIDHGKQLGWSRIDPKGHHWHVDEIQSDFHSKDKILNTIKDKTESGVRQNIMGQAETFLRQKAENKGLSGKSLEDFISSNMDKHAEDLYNKYVEFNGKPVNGDPEALANKLHEVYSHGHDDPQHMIHSAVNQLARKHGIKSMSMDTPEDQAKQSMLQSEQGSSVGDTDVEALEEATNAWIENFIGSHSDIKMIKEKSDNKYTHSALDKIGNNNLDKIYSALADALDGSEPTEAISNHIKEVGEEFKLEDPEIHALSEVLANELYDAPYWGDYRITEEPEDVPEKTYKLPVHQLNTYKKRPKKLGMEKRPKKDVLGEHEEDKQEHVQYHRLRKKLDDIMEALNVRR